MKKFLLLGLLLSAPTFTPVFGMDWFKKSISSYYYTNDLHKAVKNGDADQVEMLLTEPTGAYDKQAYEQDQDGNTPLHLALKQDYNGNAYYVIENIINYAKQYSKNIGVNLKNNAGETPLDLALHGPCANPDQAMKLWELGADINAQDKEEQCSSCLVGLMLHESARKKALELLKTPIQVDLFTSQKRNVLLTYGRPVPTERIDVKLRPYTGSDFIKVDMTQRYKNGVTSLHTMTVNCPEALKELLTHPGTKYAINIQSDSGDTALHWAASEGISDAVATLLQHGASTDIKNNDGETPLDLATDETCIALLAEAIKQKTSSISPEYEPETTKTNNIVFAQTSYDTLEEEPKIELIYPENSLSNETINPEIVDGVFIEEETPQINPEIAEGFLIEDQVNLFRGF